MAMSVSGYAIATALLLGSTTAVPEETLPPEGLLEYLGSWDGPDIGKIQRIDVDTRRFSNCEALLPEVVPEAVLVPLPDAPAPTGGAVDSGDRGEAP